jgi:hypothetical protein
MYSSDEFITIAAGNDDEEYWRYGATVSQPEAAGEEVFSLARISPFH